MDSAAAEFGFNSRRSNRPGGIWKVHSALTLVQTSFGVSSALQKVSFSAGINPIAFAIYRGAVSVSFLAPLGFFSEKGPRTPLDWTTLALIVLLGFVGIYASHLALLFGISLAPATYGCLIGINTPIFTFLISAASGLEEIQWTRRGGQAKALGVLSGVSGTLLVLLYNGPEILHPLRHALVVPLSDLPVGVRGVFPPLFPSLEIEDWQLGACLLILAGFLHAIFLTLQDHILKRYPHPVSTVAIAYISAVIMSAATGLVFIRDPSQWAINPSTDIISIFYSGWVSFGGLYALQSWALLKAGPVLSASYSPLQSCTMIAIAWLFLGEGIRLGSILGLLCIVSGLFLITWGKVASRKEDSYPAKAVPSTIDSALIIKGDSDLEQHLLGLFVERDAVKITLC